MNTYEKVALVGLGGFAAYSLFLKPKPVKTASHTAPASGVFGSILAGGQQVTGFVTSASSALTGLAALGHAWGSSGGGSSDHASTDTGETFDFTTDTSSDFSV